MGQAAGDRSETRFFGLGLMGGRAIAAITLAAMGVVWVGLPDQARADRPCEAYSLDHPEIPPWDAFTNCPLLRGTFQNQDWRVTLATVDTGVYSYEGSDRHTGESIYLSSREVSGTEARPVYTFRNGETAYTVTFRDNDHNTIRLQVYQRGRSVLNQLLQRR